MASELMELLSEIEDESVEDCIEILQYGAESLMGSDGRTYGDVVPDRAARIARFMDLASRGVMDALEAMSPEVAGDLVKQFEGDIRASQIGRLQ